MGCNASTTVASTERNRGAPGSAASPAAAQDGASSSSGQPAPTQANVRPNTTAQPAVAQRQTPQPPAQQQAASRVSALQQATVVRSLVSFHRAGDCGVRLAQDGCYIKFQFSALAAGQASIHLVPSGAEEADSSSPEASKQAFEPGQQQTCELFLCKDFKATLEGRIQDNKDKWHAIVELKATEPSGQLAVTAQKTYLKINSSGSSAQVAKQTVRCRKSERNLEALYGVMPNPGTGTSPSGEEIGECVICLSQPKEVAILHCRHVCLCRNCAAITSSTWSFQCPVCRGRVAGMVAAKTD